MYSLQMEYGGTCNISGRPYTVFRWRPGNDARYKKTIICQEVAKAKNVCQVCLLDLDYNLPVQVRDKALGLEDDLPDSVAGKEFALNRLEESGELERGKFNAAGSNDLLNKLQRDAPYYKRNKAKICSFFVKGECKRGAECPYRHELPESGPLAEQNIKDRYYGINDPVAEKMLSKVSNKKNMPPEDRSITTLFIGNVGDSVSEDDLKSAFYPYGEIKSIKKISTKNCAFVTFRKRSDAEEAIEKLGNNLFVNNEKLTLLWGRPKESTRNQTTVGSLPSSRDEPSRMYPSMDPERDGSLVQGAKRQPDDNTNAESQKRVREQ